ncbi:MAG TPA: tetratricopeptide repeat protein [Thermoanaerobaculia bacterium]|nr:tetratricopeptide repeat protein [Thermoanaerobaculia bacterium]
MSLERIEITPFAVIAGDILQNRRNGTLTIVKAPLRKILYWSQGELVLIVSSNAQDSLADFLVRRGSITADAALSVSHADPVDAAAAFHESGALDLSVRQTLLREWTAAQFLPLFSLDEGTAAFTEEEPLPPEKRVFLQSTGALLLEGVRSITNGLVLRRSLGDLKQEITLSRHSRYDIESIALSESERRIALTLQQPLTIEAFLKQFPSESVVAAKVVIGLLALGVFTAVQEREAQPSVNFDDMQRDLELLAAIGASDQRSLRAVALSRQLASMDHYQLLDVPRAAVRQQIITAAEAVKKRYDAASFPPIVRDAILSINRRVDEAVDVLKDPVRRASYDKLIQQRGNSTEATIHQRLTQRSIADQNFARAKELSANGDYYGAIVLLKQAVQFAPDNADAWYLLGACQERNPRWRREAAESYQMALSIDPNLIDAMISLGDLYKHQGLASRAQSCYEDVLKISPENQQAKSRLSQMKK